MHAPSTVTCFNVGGAESPLDSEAQDDKRRATGTSTTLGHALDRMGDRPCGLGRLRDVSKTDRMINVRTSRRS
jgi:hypothetical protein